MRTLTKALCVATLALAATQAEAGPTRGPAAEAGTIDGGKSFWFDVELDAGRARFFARTNDAGPLGLSVYDRHGRMVASTGTNRRRIAVVDVVEAGVFRVEVRNNGVRPCRVRIGVN